MDSREDPPPPWTRLALLGLASGLPLLLTGPTLMAWMAKVGVDLRSIGLFSLVGLPYTLKCLWSPLVDRYALPPGRRRGWILASQAACALGLGLLAMGDPTRGLRPFVGLALFTALASATQDIATDAYRTELLAPRWQGLGTSVHVTGYRVGMIAAGAGALILADRMGFRAAYGITALALGVGMAAAARAPEPRSGAAPATFEEAVRAPLKRLLDRPGAGFALAFVPLYKLGDTVGLALVNPFLIQQGFTLTRIGVATKGIGLGALLCGSFLGGALMRRWPLKRALLVFGAAQALPCLALYALAALGPRPGLMVGVIALENAGYGLGMVALTAYLMRLCDRGLVATQYALLSSLAALSRVVLSAPAGWAAQRLGWGPFFLACLGLALPGMLLLTRFERWGPSEG